MATETERRLPLSRERILKAALELADESGIEALTMRKLGQVLGFEAMSLYNHVANKDDLLDGMLDLVLAECEPPSPTGDWAEAIRSSASSVHGALRRHPWACSLLMSPGRLRAARLQYMDLLLGRLRGEFSAETTYHAYHVLDGFIFGFSLWETSHTYTAEEISKFAAVLFTEIITPDAYPYLHEHAQQHMSEGPHRETSAFEFGLDLVVDGLRKIHERE